MYMFLFLFIFLYQAHCAHSVKMETFVRQTDPGLGMFSLGLVLNTDRLTSCAVKCLATDSCRSFDYQNTSGNCSLGSLLVPSPETTGRNIYSNGQFCNTTDGFQVMSSGDVTVCVYISTDSKNYTDAREECLRKNSFLFTPKNRGKFDVFLNIGLTHASKNIWCGLNDIKDEGVFVWEDDGAVLNETWKNVIFYPGQPNDSYGNEDCVEYNPSVRQLNDNNCSVQEMFVCERPT